MLASMRCSRSARAVQLAALLSNIWRLWAVAIVTASSRSAVARSRQPSAVSRLCFRSGPGEGFKVLPLLTQRCSGAGTDDLRLASTGRGEEGRYWVMNIHQPAGGSAMSLSHQMLREGPVI